jgi:glycogen synthase
MHIIYVTRELPASLRCGGIGSYIWDISMQILKYGNKVTIICASDDTKTENDEMIAGVRIIRLSGGDFAIPNIEPAGNNPLKRNIRTITRYWSYRKKIADYIDELIDDFRVDIVEFAEYGSEAVVWMKRQRRIPMVIRLHTPTFLNRMTAKRIHCYPWNFTKYYFALQEYNQLYSAQAITSCSKALSKWVAEDAKINEENIEIIPNPINYNEWKIEIKDYCNNTSSEIKKVFFAGTVVKAKGAKDLFNAVSLLRKKGLKVELNLAGRWGDFGRSMNKRLNQEMKLSEWVKLLGNISREELRYYYSSSSVVCFPSWWEAYGIVCIEAMACGALVIGTSAGGMSEIIEDEVDGFLVEPKDPLQLANKIKYILSLPEEKKIQIRIKAQEKIKHTFDMKIVLPKMLRFYEKVISEFKHS